MKKLCCIIFSLLCSLSVTARHVAGGELYYEYLGPGNLSNTSTYRVTLRLFRECSSTGPQLRNEVVVISLYVDSVIYSTLRLPIEGEVKTLKLRTDLFPCLVGDPEVCYEVAIYTNTITLPNNESGYLLTRNSCCRIDNISNLTIPLNVGSNYITKIPGKSSLPEDQHNNSPQFRVRDTALVCSEKKFSLDFGATDQDGDQLTYSFCTGFASSVSSVPGVRPPVLTPLAYAYPFSGTQPLGSKVTIDAKTGIISGIAPPNGQYVVSVCITEWRNGKAISEHRKDFILKVDNCDLIEADLPPRIIKCDDNIVKFENNATSSAITSYLWEFALPGKPSIFSSEPTPKFTYADTGKYKAYLTIKGPEDCQGTDSTEIWVYPGFKVDFTSIGFCSQAPYEFIDASTTQYGNVNSWKWDFGVDTTLADTAIIANPQFQYAGALNASVKLIVTSSKGCTDSISKKVIVTDKPIIQLAFKDTVICSIDSLLIPVTGAGNFTWTPNNHIVGINSDQPIVFPKDTTKYIVTTSNNGCVNTDTVTVNVLDYITVQVAQDTTICATDSIILRTDSHALSYSWTPSSTLNNARSKNPIATPTTTTTYTVIGNLGKCQATDQITITVVPYPQVNIITTDTTICYGSRIQLIASYKGNDVRWTPSRSLLNANNINPIAGPDKTTLYTLSVRDTISGCPKTVQDSVRVIVTPKIYVNAGRDTMLVPNQLLTLAATASSGSQFNWTPALGLSDPTIYNPTVQLGKGIDSVIYRVRVTESGGCYGEDDLTVKIFKNMPDILVPSGFTPNGDGKNDILKPIPVGITELHYFRIYNRWGQLIFSTSQQDKGWDGRYNGIPQSSGTYVFVTQGKDVFGKNVFRKGTTVLIR